ncbi:hypothetical protein SCLCIDRAFT_1208228 [Scleroderma citrinum Foug A]|uniref:Uncharacterized protein n=1 Tax=Scleroderma citrinum Foug A TaxID=1036808 RepID=A0A0C3ENG1_9AGAM|nr:hypothetical protein SCLCIDRAFT_1208228 [Scleroderma citrinum Foug A]
MGWFSSDSDQANAYENGAQPHHEASTAHELISGAASYEAMKAWEDHKEGNGKPTNHREAYEILAGVAGAFIDSEFETKGLDVIDRFMKEHAKKRAEEQIQQQLSQNDYPGASF